MPFFFIIIVLVFKLLCIFGQLSWPIVFPSKMFPESVPFCMSLLSMPNSPQFGGGLGTESGSGCSRGALWVVTSKAHAGRSLELLGAWRVALQPITNTFNTP